MIDSFRWIFYNTCVVCETLTIKEWCKEPDQKYIYAYWNNPDGELHRHGLKSDEVHKCMLEMEDMIKEMAEELSDTLIVVTAGHRHIDNDMVVLQDYPQLCDCLVRMPSLEPRVLNCLGEC